MTLMFWDDHKHSMLIPHHQQLKLPIFLTNKGITLSSLTAKAQQHQCTKLPLCMNTSTPILSVDKQGNENVHIIPLDDDEKSFHELKPSNRKIIIDKLDQLDITKRYDIRLPHYSANPNDYIFDAEDSTLTQESSGTVHSITDDSSVDDGISTAQSIFSDGTNDRVDKTTTIDEAAHELVHGPTEDQKEWLQYHYALKHLPILYMKRLTDKGVIPKRLEKIKPPICVACLKGKQHQTP